MKLTVFNILSPKIQCLQKINEKKMLYNISNKKKAKKCKFQNLAPETSK